MISEELDPTEETEITLESNNAQVLEELQKETQEKEEEFRTKIRDTIVCEVQKLLIQLEESLEKERSFTKKELSNISKLGNNDRNAILKMRLKNEEVRLDSIEERKAEWEIAISIRKEEVDILHSQFKKIKEDVQILSVRSAPEQDLADVLKGNYQGRELNFDESRDNRASEDSETIAAELAKMKDFPKSSGISQRLEALSQRISVFKDDNEDATLEKSMNQVNHIKGQIMSLNHVSQDLAGIGKNTSIVVDEITSNNREAELGLNQIGCEVERSYQVISETVAEGDDNAKTVCSAGANILQVFQSQRGEVSNLTKETQTQLEELIRRGNILSKQSGEATAHSKRMETLGNLIAAMRPIIATLKEDVEKLKKNLETANDRHEKLTARKQHCQEVAVSLAESKGRIATLESSIESAKGINQVMTVVKDCNTKVLRKIKKQEKNRLGKKLVLLQTRITDQEDKNKSLELKLKQQRVKIESLKKKASGYAHDKKILARDACSEIERLSTMLYS